VSEAKKYANLITELEGEGLSRNCPEDSGESNRRTTTRRAFFHEVTAGAAGIAVASALAQSGSPATVMGQEEKKPSEGLRVPNTPPWPTGTVGNKYDHLFCTRLKERSLTPEAVASPVIGFEGAGDIPGSGMNLGFALYTKPIKLELQSHHHDVDEYLIFLGAQLPDLTANFDAEIEMFLGEEYERHVITKPTVLYIPRGMEHNPMDIKRLGKPMLFCPIHLAPYFNAVYRTGYMQLPEGPKID
jgi:hypothetical protein